MATFRVLLTGAMRLFFSFIYPAYGTINALESVGGADDTQQLMYWLVFSLITLFESFLWPVLKWVPLYQEFKIAVLAWLVLPQFKGATWVYEDLLAPAIAIGRREASKIPALDKLLNEGAGPISHPSKRTTEGDTNAYQTRSRNLEQSVTSAKQALQSQLETIRGSSNHESRHKAERTFDRDLSKLNKIAQSGSMTGKGL